MLPRALVPAQQQTQLAVPNRIRALHQRSQVPTVPAKLGAHHGRSRARNIRGELQVLVPGDAFGPTAAAVDAIHRDRHRRRARRGGRQVKPQVGALDQTAAGNRAHVELQQGALHQIARGLVMANPKRTIRRIAFVGPPRSNVGIPNGGQGDHTTKSILVNGKHACIRANHTAPKKRGRN